MTRSHASIGTSLGGSRAARRSPGAARYAFEYQPATSAAYAVIVQATIASGASRPIDACRGARAAGRAGRALARKRAAAGRRADAELAVLQSDRDRLPRPDRRGRSSPRRSRRPQQAAQRWCASTYDEHERTTPSCAPTTPKLIRPETVNPNFPTDTIDGDVDAALATAAFADRPRLRDARRSTTTRWSRTPTIARVGASAARYAVRLDPGRDARCATRSRRPFGLEPGDVHVISPHVGGGFGSKGTPRPHVVVAAMARAGRRPAGQARRRRAARCSRSPGYRTPTIQRVRLGAERDGRPDGDHPRRGGADLEAAGLRRADCGSAPG